MRETNAPRYHAQCIFNAFRRARKNTRVIESVDDLEGFSEIEAEDQEMLRRIIAGTEDLRAAQFAGVPRKRGAEEPTHAAKRRKEEEDVRKQVDIRKGNRVWTHCRVRVADRDGMPAAGKSQKRELGMIVEEETDGQLLIQFESKEHEKERLEMLQKKRYSRIRGWLRYPRLFEGTKQKVPLDWIDKTRQPPRLCGCKLQEWGHGCPCGITCSRGIRTSVWGVGQ
ncbi:unnamed protein product [Effrenium voratum]|nr:unnamed protein product [Effrenium voratum]